MTSSSLSTQFNFDSEFFQQINPQQLMNIETKAAQIMPNATAKHNYTLNALCLEAVTQWLEETIIEDNESITIPEEEYLNSCWSVVSGTSFSIGSMKIAVIPSESVDLAGMVIPREWVDIPEWIPDYFIATQIDLQQKSILLWGYVSANTVKQRATLDRSHQNYILSQDWISLDLELFGITETFVSKPQTEKELNFSPPQLDRREVLHKLSSPSDYSPRLDLPFEIWSTLISDKQWCQELYQQRCLNAVENNSATNLLQWLQEELITPLKSGWQELSELFTNTTQTPQLSFALRDESSHGNEKWVKKAKVIDLKVQLDDSIQIILLIAIAKKAEDKFSIIVRLHPDSDRKFLPASINLELLSSSELLKKAISRSQDRYLQLGFTCPVDTSFEIQVTFQEKVYFQEVFLFE